MDFASYTVELKMKNKRHLSSAGDTQASCAKLVVPDKSSRKAKSNGMTEFTRYQHGIMYGRVSQTSNGLKVKIHRVIRDPFCSLKAGSSIELPVFLHRVTSHCREHVHIYPVDKTLQKFPFFQ